VGKAFALARKSAHRTLSMRHVDVQLIGGLVLLKGMVAEMETGEGKTLTATFPPPPWRLPACRCTSSRSMTTCQARCGLDETDL